MMNRSSRPRIITARSNRVVDMPEWYGGGYDLVSGTGVKVGQYGKSPWAFACMQIRGSELANIPWHIVGADGKVLLDHPLVKLIKTFGRESNYKEAVIATEIDLFMFGAGYWLYDIDTLVRLAANTITVKADATGIQEFVQTLKGKVVHRFSRDEVIYFRDHNPESDLLPGVPTYEVIKNAVEIEHEAALYVAAHFKNDAIPGLLLTTDKDLAQEEMDGLLAWFNRKFRGTKHTGKTGMLSGGMKAQLLSADMAKQALTQIRDQARSDICVGSRVPKILVGAMTEATYANAVEARKFFVEDWAIPRAGYYEDVINADLVARLYPEVSLRFATDELEIMQEDATAKAERLGKLRDAGLITDTYLRSELGIPESAAPTPLAEQPAVMRSWFKKATRAFRNGQSPNVPFETDDLPPALQAAIRAKLDLATSLVEVERSFWL